MQTYTKDRYRSRGITIGEEGLPCEKCLYELKEGSLRGVDVGVDINHLTHSFRGERTHKKDGSDLMLVCLSCHKDYHSQVDNNGITNNGYDLNKKHLAIAKEMISIYVVMGHKEKLRKLVEILYSKVLEGKQRNS